MPQEQPLLNQELEKNSSPEKPPLDFNDIISEYFEINNLTQEDLDNNPGFREDAQKIYATGYEGFEKGYNDGELVKKNVFNSLDKHFERKKLLSEKKDEPLVKKEPLKNSPDEAYENVKKINDACRLYGEKIANAHEEIPSLSKLKAEIDKLDNFLSKFKDNHYEIVRNALQPLIQTRQNMLDSWLKARIINKVKNNWIDRAHNLDPEERDEALAYIDKAMRQLPMIDPIATEETINKLESMRKLIEQA